MKGSMYSLAALLLFLVGCDATALTGQGNQQMIQESILMDEVTMNEVSVGTSYDEAIQLLGEPTSEEETTPAKSIKEMVYEDFSLFTKDDQIVGISDQREDAKTTAGIVHDYPVDELLAVYNESVQKFEDRYYIYDDSYFLVFDVDPSDNHIKGIGLYERGSFLSLLGISFDKLILNSKEFSAALAASEPEEQAQNSEVEESKPEEVTSSEQEKTSSEAPEPEVEKTTGSNQEKKKTTAKSQPEKETEKDPTPESQEAGQTEKAEDVAQTEKQEEVEQQEYYDPFKETDELAAFSKTVSIGDSEQVVQDYMGEGYINGRDETMTMYDSPPIGFVAQEGVITFISWGRSGSFEQWETKEGIGRRSTLEAAKQAYANFGYQLLYKQGSAVPSYMKIDYPDGVLVFELTDNRVSFIFRCAPEMLDNFYIKDVAFTYDELKEQPW